MSGGVKKAAVLFLAGGGAYTLLEALWRGYSHWTMALAGGLCFLIVGALNEYFPWSMSLLSQGVIGAAAITAVELLFGLALNVWLGLDVWDYSGLPLNFMGQISLRYSLLWIPLSMLAVVADDWLRCLWFGEERPTYSLL